MEYKYLCLDVEGKFLGCFDSESVARKSWQITYSTSGGVTFWEGEYIIVTNNDKEVGNIRAVEYFNAPNHL